MRFGQLLEAVGEGKFLPWIITGEVTVSRSEIS